MGEEYLTIEQVEAKYPNEWVLLDKLKKGRRIEDVRGGVVVAHGPDHDAVLFASDKLDKPFDLKFWYTGPIPDDVVFIL